MKRPRPDLRPSWRDPALLVVRNYRMADGSCKIEVDPDYERRYREHCINNAVQPEWREDPTYNLKRRK